MVTSYVPADPLLPDRSVLRGPRPVSDRSLLYHQWACYRLASLQAQVFAMMDGEASCMIDRGREYLCNAKHPPGWNLVPLTRGLVSSNDFSGIN